MTVYTCGNSTACCLVTKPGSLLLPLPLFSKPVAPPPPPPPPPPPITLAQTLSTFSGPPLLGKFIEVCFVLERFCKNQLIVCHNRTVSTENYNQGAKINLAMAILIVIFQYSFSPKLIEIQS